MEEILIPPALDLKLALSLAKLVVLNVQLFLADTQLLEGRIQLLDSLVQQRRLPGSGGQSAAVQRLDAAPR